MDFYSSTPLQSLQSSSSTPLHAAATPTLQSTLQNLPPPPTANLASGLANIASGFPLYHVNQSVVIAPTSAALPVASLLIPGYPTTGPFHQQPQPFATHSSAGPPQPFSTHSAVGQVPGKSIASFYDKAITKVAPSNDANPLHIAIYNIIGRPLIKEG
jgi:hypothetical protein